MRSVHILEEKQTPRRRAAQMQARKTPNHPHCEVTCNATRGVAVHAKLDTEAGSTVGIQNLAGNG